MLVSCSSIFLPWSWQRAQREACSEPTHAANFSFYATKHPRKYNKEVSREDDESRALFDFASEFIIAVNGPARFGLSFVVAHGGRASRLMR
jgi:hypothetical protein